MEFQLIQRDDRGLATTQYCRERPEGGITITAGHIQYDLDPERIADGPAFAETWMALDARHWFTPQVACDLVRVVAARWYAKAQGLL